MKPEDLIAICRKAKDIGAVKHEDYADYIVVMSRNKKDGDRWVPVENAYMAVDGRLAMANADHRAQAKKLDIVTEVIVDDADRLTVRATVVSELYGTRVGMATSRKKNGAAVEREFPLEIAETSAIRRALGEMGYGLLPGTGLSSAEDMLRAGVDAAGDNGKSAKKGSATAKPDIKTCPLPNVPMRQYNGKTGPFFAHKVGSDWCHGKAPADKKEAA